jgi:WD40 repeat protein
VELGYGYNAWFASHIDLWTLASGKLAGSVDSPGDGPPSSGIWAGGAAFSPASADHMAVSGSGHVDVWSLAGRHMSAYDLPQGNVVSPIDVVDVAYTPNGKTVAAAFLNGDVYLLDAAGGDWRARSFRDPAAYSSNGTDVPVQVTVSPTGKNLAVADTAGNVYVWKLSGGSPVVVTGAASGGAAIVQRIVAFSPDGKTLAIASPGVVRLFNLATGTFSAPLTAYDGSPVAVAFAPDGTTVAVAGDDGSISLWDLATRRVKLITTPAATWAGLAFSPDGRTLAAYTGQDTKIYLYRITYPAQ